MDVDKKPSIFLVPDDLRVLHSVCELAINPVFAQASKQFDTNRPLATILLHWWQWQNRRSKSSWNLKFVSIATRISKFVNPWSYLVVFVGGIFAG